MDKRQARWRIFQRQIANKSDRKIKARGEIPNIWVGLRMFGMVGWSVAIPALLGICLGVWLDNHTEGKFFWTLILLLIGMALGCFNAWYWISKESNFK